MSSVFFYFRVKWLQGSILWKLLVDYFPVRVVKTAELDPGRNYLLGNHPHGVVCFGALGVFANSSLKVEEKVFPGINFNLLTLREFCGVPGLREAALASGRSLDKIFSKRRYQFNFSTIVLSGNYFAL